MNHKTGGGGAGHAEVRLQRERVREGEEERADILRLELITFESFENCLFL